MKQESRQDTISLNKLRRTRKEPEPQVQVELPDIHAKSAPGMAVPQANCDFSIPIIFERNEENVRIVRLRTKMDDYIAQRKTMRVPTNRAIKMANAIILEEYLTSGKYGSASKCAEMLGVSQPTVTGMLNMLNLPPDEIERILFETH